MVMTRHLCEDVAPTVHDGDLWRCPVCRRRWYVEPDMGSTAFSEGHSFYIDRGDQETGFWRPFRARWIGYPFPFTR